MQTLSSLSRLGMLLRQGTLSDSAGLRARRPHSPEKTAAKGERGSARGGGGGAVCAVCGGRRCAGMKGGRAEGLWVRGGAGERCGAAGG
eukprot:1278172-Prymnesium_polylepis.1